MAKALTKADLERFYMSRNEVASNHNNKLELEAMSRVREQVVNYQAPVVEAQPQPKENKKDKK